MTAAASIQGHQANNVSCSKLKKEEEYKDNPELTEYEVRKVTIEAYLDALIRDGRLTRLCQELYDKFQEKVLEPHTITIQNFKLLHVFLFV